MIETALVVIIGIAIGFLFAYLYFRSRAEAMAQRLGGEIGQRARAQIAFVLEYTLLHQPNSLQELSRA